MGEPGVPGETERREALEYAELVLDRVRNDEPYVPPTSREAWLLASTLKYHAETIAAYQETLRV